MYSGSKESGAIVGRIQDAEAFDLADIAENTACEESLVCADAEGNPMTLSSCLDPETGALSWVPEEDQATVNARVLGCNLMPSMLHDADRNGVFEAAITRMISYFKQHEGRAPVVLDIGAGTGLLSMMAAKAGASSVIGCEMFDTMARAATEVVQDNALADTVQIVEAKSTDLEQGLGADLLVSELLDSALLGESVMFSHADAVQRLLAAPGGPEASLPVEHRVLPHSAHVYCTLVQSDELQNMHDVSGLCFGADANATRDAAMQPGEEGEESKGVGGTPWRNPWAEKCRGGWALLPLHWKSLKARTLAAAAAAATTSKAVQVELSLAAPVLSFEFFHAEAEGGADHCYDTDIQVTAAGRVTGLLFYWKLWLLSPLLDPARELHYSTKPGDNNWQDHWVQVVFPLPQALQVQKGDVIRVTCVTDNLRFWSQAVVLAPPPPADSPSQERGTSGTAEPVAQLHKRVKPEAAPLLSIHKRACSKGDDPAPVECSCGWHLLHSPDRLLMLNDTKRRDLYEKAVQQCMQGIAATLQDTTAGDSEYNPLVLDMADGSVLGLTAAHFIQQHGGLLQEKVKIMSREAKSMAQMFYGQLARANGVEDVFSIWDGVDIAVLDEAFFPTEEDSEEEEEEEEGEEVGGKGDDEAMVTDAFDSKSTRIVALISDCYQFQMQARQVWQALSFHYQRSALQPLLATNAQIMPRRARIMIAALQLTDLHVSHGNVGTVAGAGGGYNHDSFDRRQHGWHTHWLPYRLSDYEFQVLAGPTAVQELDYCNVAKDLPPTEQALQVTATGRCDCMAVWVDYDLCDDPAVPSSPSTLQHMNERGQFPSYLKVNLRLFQTPQMVAPSREVVCCKSSFTLGESDLRYDFAVQGC